MSQQKMAIYQQTEWKNQQEQNTNAFCKCVQKVYTRGADKNVQLSQLIIYCNVLCLYIDCT